MGRAYKASRWMVAAMAITAQLLAAGCGSAQQGQEPSRWLGFTYAELPDTLPYELMDGAFIGGNDGGFDDLTLDWVRGTNSGTRSHAYIWLSKIVERDPLTVQVLDAVHVDLGSDGWLVFGYPGCVRDGTHAPEVIGLVDLKKVDGAGRAMAVEPLKAWKVDPSGLTISSEDPSRIVCRIE